MLQTRKSTAHLGAVGSSRPHAIRLAFDAHRPPLQAAALGLDKRARYPDENKRWSPKATIVMSGGVSLLLWGAIGLAIYALR